MQGSQEVCHEEDTSLRGLQALPISRSKCILETDDVLVQATQSPYG